MPRKHLVVPVFAGLALLTGCGAAQQQPTLIDPAAAAVQQEQPAKPVSVNAAGVGGVGTVLTDQTGKTLYLFTKDSQDPPTSTCVDKCAETWPPLLATGEVLGNGVDPNLLGTVDRPDGLKQVTVNNWPVYMYAGDTKPGEAKGQGLQDAWYAVSPVGKQVGAKADPIAVVSTEIPNFGNALTNQDGQTLYLFTEDGTKPPKSTCDGECAKKWPPLLTVPGEDIEIKGVDPDLVGTVTRSDGTVQVTVGNWPVYLFIEDKEPGETKGHGVGGVWFVIEEEGCKSTAPVEKSDSSEEADDSTGY